MASLLYQAIEQISREKHIEPEIIVAAIEDAMAVAARKYYKTEEDLRSKFNPETGQVDVYAVRAVVDEVTDPKREVSLTEGRKINPAVEVGGEVLIARPTDVLGRIAAQPAKQVIMQKVREAERDAGERTKIAVQSRDKDVDPVGACVGMKGMRVQSIIRELRGEKIDIIPFNEDTVTFAQKALSPAKVTRVQIVDPETRHLEVIVEDTQLSLAIGKKGQNV